MTRKLMDHHLQFLQQDKRRVGDWDLDEWRAQEVRGRGCAMSGGCGTTAHAYL